MSKNQQQAQARERVSVILQVLNKQLAASEAAKRLGVSRKTYYKWEKRFLSGGLEAVADRSVGRPQKKVDQEKEELKKQLEQKEKEVTVLQQTLRIREVLPKLAGENASRQESRKRRKKRTRLRQPELDLESGSECGEAGVSKHVPAGEKAVQGHCEASFSGGEGENPEMRPKPGTEAGEGTACGASERTAEKK